MVDASPLRFVFLDTLVPGQDGGELCDARLRWLADRLAEAPDRPTVIVMHHPPFLTGVANLDDMGLAGAEELARLLARFPQVERILCGHLHRSIQVRWHGVLASVCPSTAHQVALDTAARRSALLRHGAAGVPAACLDAARPGS